MHYLRLLDLSLSPKKTYINFGFVPMSLVLMQKSDPQEIHLGNYNYPLVLLKTRVAFPPPVQSDLSTGIIVFVGGFVQSSFCRGTGLFWGGFACPAGRPRIVLY